MADLTKYRFPNDTAVIAITTHGAIPVDEAGDIVKFEVPEDMTITKLSVSPIGVCNMASEDDSAEVVKKVSDVFSDPNPEYTFEDRMKQVVPELKELQSNVASRVVKSQPRGVKKDDLTYEFLVYADRSQTLKTYKSGDKIINKDYVKYEGEGKEHPYDFKMPILNMEGNPDFLQLIIGGRFGMPTRSMGLEKETYTHLSYIAGVLRHQMNVKHLILFDYSCSSFYEIDERTKRALAREAEKSGLNGGKKRRTRRPKRKTKTRKGKKRTTQWKH